MALYTTGKDSHYLLSQSLGQSLKYLSETAAMTLYTLKNVNVGSSQTIFNPDGNPIADTVQLTMRSSSIGSNSVDLKFYYDPYDWSFPPDLIIHGNLVKPSLQDIGLDDSWDQNDASNLSTVIGKLSRMMQHGERERVQHCDYERIQVEYSCLQDMEEMDCCLIPGTDGPTKVLFAVPFYIPYTEAGKSQQLKVVVKVQYLISSLMGEVMDCKGRLETLSSFDHPEIIESIPALGRAEHIVDYIERITRRVKDHFERLEKLSHMKKDFIEAITKIFRENLIEYDAEHYKVASFLINVPKDSGKADAVMTAITTFYLPESFPDDPPRMTLSSPTMPYDSYTATPKPESIKLERYSPRWGVDQIISAIWEQLWDEIPRFHNRAYKASVGPTSS